MSKNTCLFWFSILWNLVKFQLSILTNKKVLFLKNCGMLVIGSIFLRRFRLYMLSFRFRFMFANICFEKNQNNSLNSCLNSRLDSCLLYFKTERENRCFSFYVTHLYQIHVEIFLLTNAVRNLCLNSCNQT